MSTRMSQLLTLAVCIVAACSIGCRAGQANQPGIFQQPGTVLNQPNFGQFGQRVGNIAVNQVINSGISRLIGGF